MSVGKKMTELVPDSIHGGIRDALNRWFDVFAFGIGGEKSRTSAVLFSNITQRSLAERALVQREQRFRALTPASSNVVYRMSPD